MAKTLTTSYQEIAWASLGSTGSLSVYIRLYAKINSQSTANNTSSVSYQSRLYAEGSGSYFSTYSTTTKSISGTGASGSSQDASGTYYKGETTLQTITGTVTHNNDGSKTVTGSANFTSTSWGWNATATPTETINLPRINRAAITNSVTGSDIEQNFSVNYTKYLDTYQYKLRISLPYITALETIDNYVSDSAITLSQETIEALYQRYTTTNTFNLGFAVETWNGTTKISDGNEKVITARITGATPIFNDFDFNDINPTTLALTGNSKYNINNYSTIRVTIDTTNKAEAQKGASMIKYQLMIGNVTKEVNYSDSENVYIDIPNASIGEYKVYAIDSRNNSTLVTKLALQNIAYEPLYIDYNSSSVERTDDGLGENIELDYKGTIWNNSFGDVSNSIVSATYEYQEIGTNNWITPTNPTDITPTITENNITFNGLIRSDETDYLFNISKSYNIRITLQDKLSSYTLTLNPVPSGIPNISLNKNGVGIMCDYDESLGGLLQVGGEVYGEEVYSTNEVKTNKKWINDKFIYRKVYEIITSSTSGTINVSNLNIDDCINLKGWEYNSSLGYADLYLYNSNIYNTLYLSTSGIQWRTGWAPQKIYIVIEYTKTTD